MAKLRRFALLFVFGAQETEAKIAAPARRIVEAPVRRTQALGITAPAPAALHATKTRRRAFGVDL